MTIDLFAGIPVDDYAVALTWYERLLGSPPAFSPNDTEDGVHSVAGMLGPPLNEQEPMLRELPHGLVDPT